MKSPLGSIVRAGNTADGDANANIMASRSGGASDLSQPYNTTNEHESKYNHSKDKQQTEARQQALEEAKLVLTSLSAPKKKESQQQDDVEAVKPPPPPEETPDISKATPRSRSDAIAAAKKRAEERRKGSTVGSSNQGSPSKSTSGTDTGTAIVKESDTILSNTNSTNQMDWFNLLGPVANPSGHDPSRDHLFSLSTHASSPPGHQRRLSRHNNSRHNNSGHNAISHDHYGSDISESYATSLLNAAGMQDLASYTRYAESTTQVAMDSMASGLDDITGWFDHYSRKYLGTLPGIDGGSLLDGENGNDSGGIVGGLRRGNSTPIIWEEYEPEFGPEDVPEMQREDLPVEIQELDLGSVEEYLRRCGILGMRFENRGGGFKVIREKVKMRKRGGVIDGEIYSTEAATSKNLLGGETSTYDAAKTIEAVPEVFFSPYFDLTDPICFEKLLVVSDDEVAEMRTKEAELDELTEQNGKDAKEGLRRDAENKVITSRPPTNDDASSELTNMPNQLGTSVMKDTHRTKPPVEGNFIMLRKPETFTTHLDAIELALLDQVRSKSSSFFRETNRFSELKNLVTASVDEVQSLRTDLQSLRERCVTNVELVPIMDDSRNDLREISRVLEAAEDIVNCKASIASLLSAGDHLGAIEAIRLARNLLAASPPGENENFNHVQKENDESSTNNQTDAGNILPQHKQCLSKLKALSKVGEQLNEYEKLVIRNLTDELVDTFLSWSSSQTHDGDIGTRSIDYRSPPRVALSFDRRSKIRGVVQSLRLCKQVSDAGIAYQRRLCELISVTLKTIVTECVADARSTAGNGTVEPGTQPKGTIAGVASMTLEQFIDCIKMLSEQVLGILWGAVAVNKFCIEEGLVFEDKLSTDIKASDSNSGNGHSNDNAQHAPSATAAALTAAVDLAEKSVSELLRLRREAHSLVSFDGMRQLWDTSLTFTLQLERFSGRKAYGLRSTLLAQAKSFVERKHEANMSALAAAMDSERWVQCDVSAERQAVLNRLCSGRAAFTSKNANTRHVDNISSPSAASSGRDKMADAEVEGHRYKVVWSCLLLLEMVIDDVACAAHFQTLATNVVGKVAELFRLFNTRSTQLVLGAGAIHSAARLKSINAKHLSIVTQCIALVLAILPHVRAALMAQLPAKQHALLIDLDKIKLDYSDHNEKILGKLVSIIGGIVEHSLAAKISQTNFDEIARTKLSPEEHTPFIESVVTNTEKMHKVLNVMLPPELLRDVFSQIFAYLDHKVPSLYKEFAVVKTDSNALNKPRFSMPTTDEGKRSMIEEIEYMTEFLNCLEGVQPWQFTAIKVLERELDIEIEESTTSKTEDVQPDVESDEKKETEVEPSPHTELFTTNPSTVTMTNLVHESIRPPNSPSETETLIPISHDETIANSEIIIDAIQPNGKENDVSIEEISDSSRAVDESKTVESAALDPVDSFATPNLISGDDDISSIQDNAVSANCDGTDEEGKSNEGAV